MGAKKTAFLGVNMRPEDHERIKAAAKARDLWTSEWVREVLFRAAAEIEAREGGERTR